MKSVQGVFVISLGCSKNLVDTEHMVGMLDRAGYPTVSRMSEASIALVNTCGFIQDAVEESIETVLDLVERKRRGELSRIVVAGCFVQRYGYKLRREIPEVDGWLGPGMIHRIIETVEGDGAGHSIFLIDRPRYLADHRTPRRISGPGFSTYLKIAEGCSHGCSFCTIPSLRGPLRSRTIPSLLHEARRLVEEGTVELNVIAQDTTAYGRDRGGKSRLEDVLEALLEVEGLRWVRVQYAHPFGITDRLLDLMEAEERICPYLDIPFQHVNAGILKAMKRGGGDEETPAALVGRIRSRSRSIRLRTTLMVGFPGETEEAFEELVTFVAEAGLDFVGTFVFSPEAGAPAARFPNPVPRHVAEARRDRVMRIQAEISLERMESMVGRIEPVLIEGLCPETDLLVTGRTAGMAPDVDGRVLINRGEASVGSIVPVRFTEAHPYDLVGEIVGQS
ncbi:MAG: 30S ribosomal protein S12 methylthiotransferase RimO [Desulfobacteraceae bacterium]|jgi:ribosomal protein S12 methylthiotransferase